MIIRPDRRIFWGRYKRYFKRLVVIVPAAVMATLLLVGMDWRPLRVVHVEWLLNVALFLLIVLWCGIAVALIVAGLIEVFLRTDRVELNDGVLLRHLWVGSDMKTSVDGATVSRVPLVITVQGASKKGRVLIPSLFYSRADVDRLMLAAGIGEEPPTLPTPPG
jgi:hypothetical protein